MYHVTKGIGGGLGIFFFFFTDSLVCQGLAVSQIAKKKYKKLQQLLSIDLKTTLQLSEITNCCPVFIFFRWYSLDSGWRSIFFFYLSAYFFYKLKVHSITPSQIVGGKKNTFTSTGPESCVGNVHSGPFTRRQERETGCFLRYFMSNSNHPSSLN